MTHVRISALAALRARALLLERSAKFRALEKEVRSREARGVHYVRHASSADLAAAAEEHERYAEEIDQALAAEVVQ